MIVEVGGRRMDADLVRAGDQWSLLVRPSEGPALRVGKSYEVALRAAKPGVLEVTVDGSSVEIDVDRTWWGRRSAPPVSGRDAGAGPLAIVAPMPGRVVKLLVRMGEAIGAGQGLVVVEAMKMENELRAPRAGIVAEVRVTEGTPVDARTVLLVLAPRAGA